VTKLPKHHLDNYADDFIGTLARRDPDELLDTRTLARLIHVSVQWLEIGRCSGYGPKFVRINKRVVRYRVADVLAWLHARSEQPER
jgi:hypothetical protein